MRAGTNPGRRSDSYLLDVVTSVQLRHAELRMIEQKFVR